ncbi:leucine-rich repeat-containing protein 18 [Takifugu flavidus]|nr:leucine-rich repeat-containing protein 18 [Takifugu flavidus]
MPRRKNVSLKTAKKAIRIMPDGRCRLDLRNMGITNFPSWLFKLTSVTELDLSCNQLKKLPDNIGSFLSLRRLDLHSNKLESLPESIGSLVRLTHLNLCNNRLTSASFPSSVGFLTNLKSLNLGLNQLDSLPPVLVALDGLEELGLFDNQLVILPDFLKDLRNLTKVNLKGNHLLCAQEDSEKTTEKSAPAEEVYLVHESSLCDTCITRCVKTRRDGEAETLEGRKIETYPGLMVPNSVAIRNQDQWRIRTNNLN